MVSKFIAVLDKTKGRDKIIKFIQYFIKLVIHMINTKKYLNMDIKNNLIPLESNLSTTRKIFKLLAFLNLLLSVKKYRTSKKRMIDVVELFTAIFDAFSSVCDHILLLIKFNLLPTKIINMENKIDNLSRTLWLCNVFIERYMDFFSIYKNPIDVNVWQKKSNMVLKICENIFDAVVQFSQTKIYIIISGMIASIISLYILF